MLHYMASKIARSVRHPMSRFISRCSRIDANEQSTLHYICSRIRMHRTLPKRWAKLRKNVLSKDPHYRRCNFRGSSSDGDAEGYVGFRAFSRRWMSPSL
jgi:hypothetical protein